MYNHILHDHLDGGLRPSTAKELAKNIGYKPINNVEDVANKILYHQKLAMTLS